MRYINVLWAKFRRLLIVFNQLPRHPYSPYYARWEIIVHQHRQLLYEQAETTRQLQDLGLVVTAKGWAFPVSRSA